MKGSLFIVLAFCIWVGMGKIYYDIGVVKRIRDHDIELACNGLVDRIQMKAFPHGEYLWNAEAKYGGVGVARFREFYKIPDEVELWFDVWQ